MSGRSYTFTNAIVRKPCDKITNGLRAVDTGAPNLELFRKHHDDYIAALASTRAEVLVLNELDTFPDSVFIEDAALCLQEGAVVMRPGAPSRLGEAEEISPILKNIYDEVVTIEGPGFIEGGDILTTEKEILVGTSERTDLTGIDELGRLVDRWGYKVRIVNTPDGVLHFKTDCSLLDEETILTTKRLSASGCFDGYRLIHTADGEEACANTVRFNELVLMPDGFSRTREILDSAGYNIRQIGNSEAAKLDGGMSCLSLRFSPTA